MSAIASTPHIGYVIKTENKETPFTVVDIDGLSGNFKTLVEGATKMCLVYIGNNLPAEKKKACTVCRPE
ncbi:hypothetical protein ACOIP8_004470 [Escherichia coli]